MPLPPDDGRLVDEREAWIKQAANELRRALADPRARAEILTLLGGDDGGRRARRLAEREHELAEMELTLKDGHGHGP